MDIDVVYLAVEVVSQRCMHSFCYGSGFRCIMGGLVRRLSEDKNTWR
jgi:hypothetical protein